MPSENAPFMTGDGCKGGSTEPLTISAKVPPQANQLPMVKEEIRSLEGEFDDDNNPTKRKFDEYLDYEESKEKDNVDENGHSSNEDHGEEGKGATEHNELPDGFYRVEAVRKKRVRKGEPQYLIKWVGWPERSNTWEPMENLWSISDMIDEFEESLLKKKRRVRKCEPETKKMKQQQQRSPLRNEMSSEECSKEGLQHSHVVTKNLVPDVRAERVDVVNPEENKFSLFKGFQDLTSTNIVNKVIGLFKWS